MADDTSNGRVDAARLDAIERRMSAVELDLSEIQTALPNPKWLEEKFGRVLDGQQANKLAVSEVKQQLASFMEKQDQREEARSNTVRASIIASVSSLVVALVIAGLSSGLIG